MIKEVLFDGKVEIGISEINDGNMRFFGGDELEVIENQGRLGKFLELSSDRIARVKTVYSERRCFTEYAEIIKDNLSKYSIKNFEVEIPVSDGLITREVEVGILLPLADCLGIVAFDEGQRAVGLLHAGRQNVEQDGPKKFIEYFVNNFGSNAGDIKLYFSPHALNYHIFKLDNKGLAEAAKEQFVSAGILLDNIIDLKIDTISDKRYPSYSSGDTFKRFAVVVKQV